MKQQIIPANGGQDYDWSADHIFIKTPNNLTGGQVTLVEDTLKKGFHLPRHHHKVMTEIFYILEGEITFQFDDETVVCTAGMTITVPPMVWHEAISEGCKMLTIFTPGGFDDYLAELAASTPEQLNDPAYITALGEKYDSWMG